MLSLILAGEAIYIPVFHLNRYFKSSMLEVWNIDEDKLGDLFAVYGSVAMACYFLGGPLADKVSPKKLLATSLLATGAGSVYMASFPSFTNLYWLYAFWGASTVLLFWAPLIRATRQWGTSNGQGMAFGVLDAGRGLAAAVVASAAAGMFPAEENLSPDKLEITLKQLLWFYAAVNAGAAACVLAFVPNSSQITTPEAPVQYKSNLLQRLYQVLSSPTIWLQAVVIFSAYSVFRGFGYYGHYLEDAYDFDAKESASAISALTFIRFGAALVAGWFADRVLGVGRTLAVCFVLLIVVYGEFLASPDGLPVWLMLATLAASCLAMFGLRGIYFAPLESTGTPRELTGTAVGVICFVGFLPEIFMPKLCGRLVSNAREAGNVIVGYEQLFLILALLSLVGLTASWMLWRAER
ncbi:MFS transporter [Adhaeretor mobilis]|uniref:Inner membrane protein YihN n=1 Tax=Adhaeretor mobilis TaxID=1930276 RepID=A0A517N3J1_9BACT|nr:MFS transporter [Adhaeretor mobilis]QDT01558.1 Inner membrane protein YihN [Adhaeretor mobilis]